MTTELVPAIFKELTGIDLSAWADRMYTFFSQVLIEPLMLQIRIVSGFMSEQVAPQAAAFMTNAYEFFKNTFMDLLDRTTNLNFENAKMQMAMAIIWTREQAEMAIEWSRNRNNDFVRVLEQKFKEAMEMLPQLLPRLQSADRKSVV